MKLIKLILRFPFAMYLAIFVEAKTLWIASILLNHFIKLVEMTKSRKEPILTHITIEGTKYTAWLGEYEHDLLMRLTQLSDERNYWKEKCLKYIDLKHSINPEILNDSIEPLVLRSEMENEINIFTEELETQKYLFLLKTKEHEEIQKRILFFLNNHVKVLSSHVFEMDKQNDIDQANLYLARLEQTQSILKVIEEHFQ
ncbi:MAG: hypothetical protein O9346_01885 [Leptospiraceae bacterium]|nr:hypothetical protein [Leptospiraceae bacterium]